MRDAELGREGGGGVRAARADGRDVESGGAEVAGEGVGDAARGEDAPAQAGGVAVRSCSEVSGARASGRPSRYGRPAASSCRDACLGEGGVEVGQDVGEVLQADREAHGRRADARLGQLRGRQVAVRHRCRVRHEAARVADVGDEAHDPQARDELLDLAEVLLGVPGRVQVEREDRPGAARQVDARRLVPRARLEARVVDASDGGMLLEEPRDAEGALAVTRDPEVERLDALQQLEGVERRQRRAEVVDVLGLDERDVRRPGLAESLDEAARRARGGTAAVSCGQRCGSAAKSKVPRSTTTPPSDVPCPPRNFVAECTTMSAPTSFARCRYGVATVLSMTSGTPARCAMSDDRPHVEHLGDRVRDRLGEERARLRAAPRSPTPRGRPGRRRSRRCPSRRRCPGAGRRCRRRAGGRRRCARPASRARAARARRRPARMRLPRRRCRLRARRRAART